MDLVQPHPKCGLCLFYCTNYDIYHERRENMNGEFIKKKKKKKKDIGFQQKPLTLRVLGCLKRKMTVCQKDIMRFSRGIMTFNTRFNETVSRISILLS